MTVTETHEQKKDNIGEIYSEHIYCLFLCDDKTTYFE